MSIAYLQNGKTTEEAPPEMVENIINMFKGATNKQDIEFALACLENIFRNWAIKEEDWNLIKNNVSPDIFSIIWGWCFSGQGMGSYVNKNKT